MSMDSTVNTQKNNHMYFWKRLFIISKHQNWLSLKKFRPNPILKIKKKSVVVQKTKNNGESSDFMWPDKEKYKTCKMRVREMETNLNKKLLTKRETRQNGWLLFLCVDVTESFCGNEWILPRVCARDNLVPIKSTVYKTIEAPQSVSYIDSVDINNVTNVLIIESVGELTKRERESEKGKALHSSMNLECSGKMVWLYDDLWIASIFQLGWILWQNRHKN